VISYGLLHCVKNYGEESVVHLYSELIVFAKVRYKFCEWFDIYTPLHKDCPSYLDKFAGLIDSGRSYSKE